MSGWFWNGWSNCSSRRCCDEQNSIKGSDWNRLLSWMFFASFYLCFIPFFVCLVWAWSFILILYVMSTGCIKEVPILIAKPQAYMNFSGESVNSISCLTAWFDFVITISWFLLLDMYGYLILALVIMGHWYPLEIN